MFKPHIIFMVVACQLAIHPCTAENVGLNCAANILLDVKLLGDHQLAVKLPSFLYQTR